MNEQAKIPEMLTIRQTAKRTNVPEFCIRRLVAEQRITTIRSGKRVLINLDNFIEFLQKGDLDFSELTQDQEGEAVTVAQKGNTIKTEESKKSFVLYNDFWANIKRLLLVSSGRVLHQILAYVNGETPDFDISEDVGAEMLWITIKNALDRDADN